MEYNNLNKIYKTDFLDLYHCDCMELLRQTPDNYYSLALVDPPYGIGQPKQGNLKGYNGRKSLEERLHKNRLNIGAGKLKDRKLNTSNCEWDNEIPSPEYFEQLRRVSKNQIIWGGNYFSLPPTRGIICWDKEQFFTNFSAFEYAWTSFYAPSKIFKLNSSRGNTDKCKIHPTQKHVYLYAWLLKNYAKEGDKILDTHLGSGSSRIAAYKMGYDFVGCEIDKEYFEASKERFNRECLGEYKNTSGKIIKQLNLFDE